MNDDWMTTEEAATYLGYRDKSRIRQLVRDGVLKASKRGRDLFLTRAELDRFKQHRAVANEEKRGRPYRVPQGEG